MEEKIRKYVRFLLTGCLKLKCGDKLFVIGTTLYQQFIDIVKDEAQKLGIINIEFLISNPWKQKELYLNMSVDELVKDQNFDKSKYNEMAREGYAFLNIYSPIPNFFDGVDEEVMTKVSSYQLKSIEEYREYQNKGLIKWNISSVPNEFWAKSINLSLEELWNYIFDICLINDDNPNEAWEQKINCLKLRADYLNNLHIDKLVYQNSLGTNLEIGLPNNYLFCSAEAQNLVNMPTEEVFTSPDRLRVNGRVYSSKKLIHNESVIDEFWLEFKNGKVVDYDAKVGKDILKGIIETDEGSSYLGEVALVDYDSPISKTNIVFNNTLYDENSTCHLALGASFAECVEDGLGKNEEELLKLGLNYSHEHVDFFVGNRDLIIKAYLKNGQEIVIMKEGNFVMEDV